MMNWLEGKMFSRTLGMSMPIQALVPQGEAPEGGWPVLYLLHGSSDDESAWMRWTALERKADKRGLAIVMATGHLSFYLNMRHGGRYFDYFSQELPRVCAQALHVSTDRQHVFVAGNSMGGYGAMMLAMRCP
nr:alpha/beta hydrolase-fold protein [bacterium]